MSKSSKIAQCLFKSEWRNPSGGIVYYHDLVLENGDRGSVGKKDKMPAEIQPGRTITYTIEGTKMKIERENQQPQQSASAAPAAKASGYVKTVKHTDYLGYSYGYAKDLIIAGKTTKKDMENLKLVAETIYAHIGELIKQE